MRITNGTIPIPQYRPRRTICGVGNSSMRALRWVDDHGQCLYRYPLVRARKPEVAEDLAQETRAPMVLREYS